MSAIRRFYGLVWTVWAVFWVIVAQEILGWPFWLPLIALILFALTYNLVPNWWAPGSGLLTFLLFWAGGSLAIWLWSINSPAFEYTATRIGNWATLGLFCAYVGMIVFKVGATLEAFFNPGFFNPKYLEALRQNKDYEDFLLEHSEGRKP